MKLGISGQALGQVLSFADIVKTGKKYGVTNYEIWPDNAPGSGNGYSERNIDTIKKVTADESVCVYCVTTGGAFGNVDNINGYVEDLCSAVETAVRLGASCVNHYCANICKGEADFERMEAYWLKPLRLAEKYGIVLALENEAHDATRTPDKMLRVIKHFDSPCFKTNLDATNYFQAGCNGFPDAYETLAEEIGYVHIKNARKDWNGDFGYVPIPDGSVNIPGLLSRIERDAKYSGICTLEPHTSAERVEYFYKRESEWLYELGFFK